jgi:hypothetical protein
MVGGQDVQEGRLLGAAPRRGPVLCPLTHELAETMPRLDTWLGPWAEKVAHMRGQARDGQYRPVTNLTGARRRNGPRGAQG